LALLLGSLVRIDVLPALVVKDAPDSGPVDVIGFRQVIQHGLPAVEALNKLFVSSQSAHFLNCDLRQLGSSTVLTDSAVGRVKPLPFVGVVATATRRSGLTSANSRHCWSKRWEYAANRGGDHDPIVTPLSGEDQVTILDIDGWLVLCADLQAVDGLEVKGAHGLVGWTPGMGGRWLHVSLLRGLACLTTLVISG